jgi:hypothetical protein
VVAGVCAALQAWNANLSKYLAVGACRVGGRLSAETWVKISGGHASRCALLPRVGLLQSIVFEQADVGGSVRMQSTTVGPRAPGAKRQRCKSMGKRKRARREASHAAPTS